MVLYQMVVQVSSSGLNETPLSIFCWLCTISFFWFTINSIRFFISLLSCIYTGDCCVNRNSFSFLRESLGMLDSQHQMLFVLASNSSWPVRSWSCLGKLQGLSIIPKWRGPVFQLPCRKGRWEFIQSSCCANSTRDWFEMFQLNSSWSMLEAGEWMCWVCTQTQPWYLITLWWLEFNFIFLHNSKFCISCHNTKNIGLDHNLVVKSG